MHGPVGLFLADGATCARIYTFGHLLHRDATVYRANAGAQVAPYALFIYDLEFAFAIDGVRDRLMRCVFADNMTTAAFDAEILIDHGLLNVIEIQVLPVGHARYRPADQFADR